jgi:hypothetical protein
MIGRRSAHLGMEPPLPVNRVTWQQVGHVTEPGRYMFRFGWLTVTADDLAIWTQFPDASFALVKTAAIAATDEAEEFHLGAFELHESSQPGVDGARVR